MPLQGTVTKAREGLTGFDVNQPLSALECNSFRRAGYAFCIRYIPRTSALMTGNLSYEEAELILASGLALSVVQHVPLPSWMPTAALGAQYGSFAASYAKNTVGLPEGMILWLDLESVSKSATSEEVIGYCTEWFNAVQSVGYIGGLYVGWEPGLNGQQLYDLPVKHYWRAYNADFTPSPRGYQMIQHTQKTLNGVAFDPNTTQADQLNECVVWLAPT